MIRSAAVEVVAPTANAVGESPAWHAGERAVYWTDIPAGTVHRLTLADGGHRAFDVSGVVSCLAVRDDGGLIVGTEQGVARLDLAEDGRATLSPLENFPHQRDAMRANDGRCDRQGRFWVGTMLKDMSAALPVGALYCHRSNAGLRGPVIEGLVVQNGLAFSPDGATLYVSDSHPSVQLIWAFDFDADEGGISNRRVFVDMNRHPGRPDGAAIDETGAYWCSANDAGMLHRFAADGTLVESWTLPVSKPSMASFGGDDLEWLFITSIKPVAPGSAVEPLAGSLLAFRPGVRGIAETRYVTGSKIQDKTGA